MNHKYPAIEKIFLHTILYKEHCKKTGIELPAESINTLTALFLMDHKASFADVRVILKEYDWNYKKLTIVSTLNKLVNCGFASVTTKWKYRITKEGKEWLSAFDSLIEGASI
jgi:predicted transcriptional regulator